MGPVYLACSCCSIYPCRLGLGDMGTVEDAARMCSCVFESNLPLLRRLIRAGAPVDAGDYDKRTALHISAAEGNAAAVRHLGFAMVFPLPLNHFATVSAAALAPGMARTRCLGSATVLPLSLHHFATVLPLLWPRHAAHPPPPTCPS
jgi:hypothetical protein